MLVIAVHHTHISLSIERAHTAMVTAAAGAAPGFIIYNGPILCNIQTWQIAVSKYLKCTKVGTKVKLTFNCFI